MPTDPASFAPAWQKIGLVDAKRHVFLCTGPECCAREVGQPTWETLKRCIKEQGAPALRTKADCLRVCQQGPILVVYPEGVWYAGVTPERCQRIVQEHLRDGRPVSEWVIARHPLPGSTQAPAGEIGNPPPHA